MAKINAIKMQRSKTDLQNLSERDRDFFTLETKDAMEKYGVGKQSVYDRKKALNKKMRAAGLSIADLLGNKSKKTAAPDKQAAAKKVAPKKGRKPKQANPKLQEQVQQPVRDIVKYEPPVPVVMKPIEINFGTFSVKLNGVPKSISINPDTNAIEIDL